MCGGKTHTQARLHARAIARTYTDTHTRARARAHEHKHERTHTRARAPARLTHIYTLTHACTHTCTRPGYLLLLKDLVFSKLYGSSICTNFLPSRVLYQPSLLCSIWDVSVMDTVIRTCQWTEYHRDRPTELLVNGQSITETG